MRSFLALVHGGITHGLQRRMDRQCEPLCTTIVWSMGDLFSCVAGRRYAAPRRVIGSNRATAAYARPSDRFTFYELDRRGEMSGPGGYFTYLSQCKGRTRCVWRWAVAMANAPDSLEQSKSTNQSS